MNVKLVIANKNYSSWSLRSWLLLREAGIPFEEIRLPLDTEEFCQRIATYSPARRVPVLLLDDEPVWDSLAIAESVAELWPEAQLWPENAASRRHARSISAEMHSGFEELRGRMPMNCRAMGRKVQMTRELERDIDRVVEIWTDCHERYGAGGDWLFGDFSVADAMFSPVVLRFRTYGVEIPDAANHYPLRLMQSEAMQSWILAAESETEVVESDEAG
jgi:glutathione S-transferase